MDDPLEILNTNYSKRCWFMEETTLIVNLLHDQIDNPPPDCKCLDYFLIKQFLSFVFISHGILNDAHHPPLILSAIKSVYLGEFNETKVFVVAAVVVVAIRNKRKPLPSKLKLCTK
jgi:hypothetical protein